MRFTRPSASGPTRRTGFATSRRPVGRVSGSRPSSPCSWLVGLAKRLTTRPGWAVPVAVVGGVGWLVAGAGRCMRCTGSGGGRRRSRSAVVAVDGVMLRMGNGESYPPRIEAKLPRGAEVRVVGQRGGGRSSWPAAMGGCRSRCRGGRAVRVRMCRSRETRFRSRRRRTLRVATGARFTAVRVHPE